MFFKKNHKKLKQIISLISCFLLIFTYIVPTQILAKPVPANSVFNQKISEQQKKKTKKLDKSFGNVPVYFEQNNGQFDERVKYFARGTNGYSLFLNATQAVYVLNEKGTSDKEQVTRDKTTQNSELETQNTKATAVYMKLVGANENASSVGLEEMSHKTNYFKGKKENWRTEIPNFKQIQINNIYQGIDAVWKGKENGAVQYDFIVKPNANPNQIEWNIEGAESVEIGEKGDLLINTEQGTIRQQKPFTYQENETNGFKQEIASKFVIKRDESTIVKFELGNYDKTKTLTIDPSVELSQLAFSTFLGGEQSDVSNSIEVDRAGNVYVTGTAPSTLFPRTVGTFDTSNNGGDDVFVTKLNASGTSLIYSTYIGGDGQDNGFDLAIDSSGNAYITGQTLSTTTPFPTTGGALDTSFNGVRDAFITKLNPTGSSLVYSTFLGGDDSDTGNSIEVDSTGNAFVVGDASSSNFPTTLGAFDTTYASTGDVFVSKLNSTGTSLVYSTFIGGTANESSRGIAIDTSGSAYVTGFTLSSDFPTTLGAIDTTFGGSFDVFVTKLNSAGSALSYSTFLGDTGLETGNGIDVDSAGIAYIIGQTDSTNYPTTSGAYDTTINGLEDVFVTQINQDGSFLLYSTFIGGSNSDRGNDIKVDAFGFAYITGETFDATTDYPITSTGYDTTHNGDWDAFVSKLSPSNQSLIYSTYIGGNSFDQSYGLAIDTNGNIFVTGITRNGTPNYPTHSEAFQTTINGGDDAFISKLGDYSIAGRTVDQAGNALSNTAVQMSRARSGFMLSDGQGYFGFSDTVNSGSFVVSATNTLYNFTPNTYDITNLFGNEEFYFVGRPTSSGPTAGFADIGGNVQSQVGNVGLANTKLTLIDAASGQAFVTHSDDNGNYVFEGRLTGTYLLVVPQKEGYNFNPGVYEVNHLQESLSNDFLATPNSPRPVNDFDGDGKTDLAVFRPSEGNWYILESQSNNVRILRFGLEGDIPVASDFDGDNKADVAVFRPTDGNWYRINSSNGEFSAIHFGTEEDKPVQADFDGDGKTDLAVYRPSTGVWHKLMSSDGSYSSIKFGIETDIPIAADYDSDGKADLTVYRNGTWYHQMSRDNSVSIYQFGLEGDKPIKGDFDGDGKIDTSLYRPSTGVWYWIESSDQDIQAKQFGIATDIPTPSDYNGDGRYEQSVFREGIWYISNSDNSFYSNQFGKMGDVPIP